MKLILKNSRRSKGGRQRDSPPLRLKWVSKFTYLRKNATHLSGHKKRKTLKTKLMSTRNFSSLKILNIKSKRRGRAKNTKTSSAASKKTIEIRLPCCKVK